MHNLLNLFHFRLWDRLQEMSQAGKTIIITTHYIEEARQANMVRGISNLPLTLKQKTYMGKTSHNTWQK